MGLIRDAVGSALGVNQLNNGLSSRPRLAFGHDNSRSGRRLSSSSRNQLAPYNQECSDYASCKENCRRSSGISENALYKNDGITYTDAHYTDDISGFSRVAAFRPLVLPQIAHGDGQPFLRGYSQELSRYNIKLEDFMQILDSINLAIIPNPENQIFQKAASIAGWFVPGTAGIGLVVGQIGVGLGVAAGHASRLSSVLEDVNMNLFLPNGLELCIGSSMDVDAEVGISQGVARPYSINTSPEERLTCYGDLIAPISHVLPPLQQSGRSDPIALLGRGLSSRESQKKVEKAQKALKRGKNKDIDNLEGGLKWILVRRASADAQSYWQSHRRR